MSQARTAPAAAAAAPSVPSRGNSQLNKRASSVVKPAEPVVEEEDEEESEYSEGEGEDVPAGAAAAPAAPAVSATPRRNSSAASGASSNSTASLADAAAPAATSSNFGVSIGEFSGEPWAGGLKKMPRQSSLPSTPKGRGVSTLHRELNDVDIPPAIFMSPFPLDTAKGHRKSLASTQGWEGQSAQDTEAVAAAASSSQQDYDKSGSDDDDEAAKPAKKLRPTSSQEAADRAKKSSTSSAPSKKDTPTISRARSRLNNDSAAIIHPATIKETRGSSIAEELSERAGRRPAGSVVVTKTSDGGLIRNADSTFPWLTAALLLLVLAQFVLLGSVGKPSEDVLELNMIVTRLQKFLNGCLGTYVQPYIGSFKLPALDLHWFDRTFESSYAQFWLVPLLYLLAGAVVRKAFEVSARDAVGITGIDALESTERKQAQYAHHVFVACNAFAGALSFWAFFMASEKFGAGGSAHAAAAATARAPAAAGAPAPAVASTVPTFSPDWYAAQLIISSLSWGLSELVNFSDVFSGVHTTLYVLLTVVTEAAFWAIMPVGALAAFPEPARKVVDLLRSYLLPLNLSSPVLLLPLLSFQAGEAIKALAGLAYGPVGRVLLWLVPLSYAFSVFQTHARTEQLAFGTQGLLLLATLAFLSSWEICNHKCQLIVRKSKQ